MMDIDHSKRINDQFGHPIGDQAIQAVAICLRAGLRLTDIVGRYGGEEFCVMFPGTPLEEASEIAERLRLRIEAEAGNRLRMTPPIVITVSAGVSSTACGPQSPLELIEQADKALYVAKEEGRNCVIAFPPVVVGANASGQERELRRITPRRRAPGRAEDKG
jgi:diguanylate cyclase (GGDEF)-like protein